jgi:fumarate reductase flavoprotein subunit
MELTRRTFVQSAAAATAAVAVPATALAEGAAAQPKSPEDTEHVVAAQPTDGKYVARAMGHEDYLYVETTVADGAIAACRVIRNDETRGIGSQACDKFPAKIVEAQSTKVDALTGATMTCVAIANAVKECLANAGLDPKAFDVEVPAPSGGEAHAELVDVVVMGAGTAGLVAATRLLEKGYNVLVFEKNSIPGGSMPTTYSGLASAGSELQANWSLGTYDESPSYNLDLMMAFLKERFGVEGDMPFDQALYETSGKTVDWLHSIGVGFHTMGTSSAYGITPYLAPGCYMGGCGQAMESLVDRIGKLGGTVVCDTPVTELVQDESGAVVGLRAEGKDGSTWDVTARAVCLASGGFGANREMVAQYYPDYADVVWNCCPGSTGDGIVLGQGVGAGIECMGRDLGSFLSTTAQAGSFFEIAFIYQTAPGIMVNGSGRQFGNIMSNNHGTMSRGLLDPENGGRFFHVTDESGAIGLMKAPLYDFETYRALFSRGDAVHYASVEEAAEALDLPELAATIETHNQLALAGEADEFGRANLPYLDTRDGIWMVSCLPTPYLTTGGLMIDTSCHVLREDGSAIAGLYAAGDVCGSVEEKDGKAYGMGFDAAMNFGYIMGETVDGELA